MSLLLAAVLSLGAEEQRRVCFSLAGPFAGEEGWPSSLEGALASSGRIGLVLRVPEGEDAPSFAALHGCDLALVVALQEGGTPGSPSVAVEWKILKPLAASPGQGREEGTAVEGSFTAPLPDERRRATSFWLEVVSQVDAVLSGLPPAGNADLTIEGPPGTVVSGLSKEPILIPDTGTISLRLRAPATYHWRASARERKSVSGLLNFLGPSSLRLELPGRDRIRLEAGLENASFPDHRFTWLPGPDWLFFRTGFSQYLAGLNLSEVSEGKTPPVFVSRDLIELLLGAGLLIGRPEGGLRMDLGADICLRIPTASKADSLDPIAPLRIFPYCGAEWVLHGSFLLFFEIGVDWYPSCDGLLMSAARKGDSGWPHFLGDTYYVELPSFRFGLRWSL
jgi:hypothetical protein